MPKVNGRAGWTILKGRTDTLSAVPLKVDTPPIQNHAALALLIVRIVNASHSPRPSLSPLSKLLEDLLHDLPPARAARHVDHSSRAVLGVDEFDDFKLDVFERGDDTG